MRDDIEKRLHRVMKKIPQQGYRCSYSKDCNNAENSARCNVFYLKYSKFIDSIQRS